MSRIKVADLNKICMVHHVLILGMIGVSEKARTFHLSFIQSGDYIGLMWTKKYLLTNFHQNLSTVWDGTFWQKGISSPHIRTSYILCKEHKILPN